jgi:hypothetical protein
LSRRTDNVRGETLPATAKRRRFTSSSGSSPS